MKIGIIGLGLIGGTIAKALNGKHIISAYDSSQESLDYALSNNIIHKSYSDIRTFLEENTVIYLCIYPEKIIKFILENKDFIAKNSVIIEISGVKKAIIERIRELGNLNFDIIYTHPIAGKEKSGVEHSDGNIFINANYVITPLNENKIANVNLAKRLAVEMGFKNISMLSPEEHDEIIAYTSQLTHVLSISLVNALSSKLNVSRYIGDSYRDLTRISMINERLWPQLFLMNKDCLVKEIDDFLAEIHNIRTAIIMNDYSMLEDLMLKSTRIRKSIEAGVPYDR